MNSSQPRGWSGTHALLCVMLCLCLGGTPLLAKSRSSEKPRAEQADVLPQTDPVAGDDLKLKSGDEKTAGAIAAFVDGFIAEDSADTERALENYQHSLALDPSNTSLAIKVATEIARHGDAPQAISILKDNAQAAPHDPLPRLYLAQFYSKFLKKPDQALKYANEAIEIDPGNFEAYVSVYELYIAANDPKNAAQILDRAAKLPHDDAQSWIQLADLYIRLLLKDEQAKIPDESVKKMNAVLEKAIAAGHDDPHILSKVGDYYIVTRQVKEAIRFYLEAVKLKPNSPDPDLAKIPEKLVRSYLAIGQREQAVTLLKKLIAENPRRAETHELLGALYEEDGKFDDAVACLRKSLAIDDQPLVYLHIADILLRQQKGAEAIELLQGARKKFPDVPQMTYSLALAFGQLKKRAEAVATFDEAVNEAQATQPEMLGAAFYFSYGAACEQNGDIEKAVECLKKSIVLDPQHADQPSNYLGYMWIERGERLDEAGELIQRAVQMSPDNGAYLDSLGWFYFKKGDYKKALDGLLKAVQNTKFQEPDDAAVYEHVGDTYRALKDNANALVYWQKAATLDPANKKLGEKIDAAKEKVTSNPAPKAE